MSEFPISKASLKMLQDEAIEVFWSEAHRRGDPKSWGESKTKIDWCIAQSVKHALDHAIEEGILAPGWQMDPSHEGSLAHQYAEFQIEFGKQK